MPTVPSRSATSPMEQIDPTYLAMAAATMHEQGRLFEPVDPKDIDEANRRAFEQGRYYKDQSGGYTIRPSRHQPGNPKGDRLDKVPGS